MWFPVPPDLVTISHSQSRSRLEPIYLGLAAANGSRSNGARLIEAS